MPTGSCVAIGASRTLHSNKNIQRLKGRPAGGRLLQFGEARRIAVNIADLPELLKTGPPNLRDGPFERTGI